MTPPRRLLASALLSMGMSGCVRSEDEAQRLDPPKFMLVETLRIGSIDEPDQALTRIGAVLPLPDGRVWVGQPQDAELRVFASDGSLLATAGGRGEGPGEFTLPFSLGYWGQDADSVWISDPVARRVSIFDRAGTFVRSFPAPSLELGEELRVEQPRMFSPDGTAIAVATYAGSADAPGGGLPIVAYDPTEANSTSEIARIARGNTVRIRWQGQVVATGSHPVSDAPLVEFAPNGRVFVLGRDADMVPYTLLTAFSTQGDTLWSRQYYYMPDVLPQSEIDSIVEAGITRFQEFTRLEGRLSDADAEAAYRQSVIMPAVRPAVQRMIVGVDGSVWMEWAAAPGDSAIWWILDSSGNPTAQLTAPVPLEVRAADDNTLWVVESDSLDVPYLVQLEVRAQ